MEKLFFLLTRLPGKSGALFFVCVLLFQSCGEPVNYPEYRLEMPALPAVWTELFGAPLWRIEWIDKDGRWARADTGGSFYPGVSLPEGWTTPVIAYPYWNGQGIYPGTMKPCGALYPLDVEGGTLRLSWQGGVDAFFYRELSRGSNENRQPNKFDWPRFRSLFSEKKISADVCADPWLADWSAIAVKTAETGFNAKRIVPCETGNLIIDVPEAGPWAGVSPFAASLPWEKGQKAVLPVTSIVDAYFCPSGILRCKNGLWVFQIMTVGPPRAIFAPSRGDGGSGGPPRAVFIRPLI
jgi:hypothetical protein